MFARSKLCHLIILFLISSTFVYGIDWGNSIGEEVSKETEILCKDVIKTFYHWQDNVNFDTQETIRNIRRFGTEFQVNVEQLEKLFNKFSVKMNQIDVKNLETDLISSKTDNENKRSRLLSVMHKFARPLLDEIKSDTSSILQEVSKTKTLMEKFFDDISNHYIMMEIQDSKLDSLKNASISDIITRRYQLLDMDKKMKKTLQEIDNKNEKIQKLLESVVALNVGQVISNLIPGYGMIASFLLAAAEMALQRAADSLADEVQNQIEKYLEDCYSYNDYKLQLDTIEISRETISQHKTEFDKLIGLLQRTESNKGQNFEMWRTISMWLGHLEETADITQVVFAQGLGSYTSTNVKNLKNAWEKVQNAARAVL